MRKANFLSDAVTHALKHSIIRYGISHKQVYNIQSNYVLQIMVSPQTALPFIPMYTEANFQFWRSCTLLKY